MRVEKAGFRLGVQVLENGILPTIPSRSDCMFNTLSPRAQEHATFFGMLDVYKRDQSLKLGGKTSASDKDSKR